MLKYNPKNKIVFNFEQHSQINKQDLLHYLIDQETPFTCSSRGEVTVAVYYTPVVWAYFISRDLDKYYHQELTSNDGVRFQFRKKGGQETT